MARPVVPARTALGTAIRAKRGVVDQDETADLLGISRPTLSRIERGTHRPAVDTAMKLAAWLGWTLEQVFAAAAAPADASPNRYPSGFGGPGS